MEEFFIKSLEPSTLWSAISAIGTLAAVLVALFLPTIQNYQKIRKITKLINSELSESLTKVLQSENHKGLLEEHKVPAKIANLQRIQLDIWDAHNNFLLATSPDTFLPYRDIYSLLAHIKKSVNNPTPIVLSFLDCDVKSFKEKYKKMFPKSKEI